MTTIQELAQLRKDLEEVKANMNIELAKFQANKDWQDMQLARAGIEEAIRITEEVVRDEAIAAYKADETNFTPALKLNTAMFEKAAKAGTIPAELAKVDTEPRAQIDSDLSKFLEG